MNDEKCGNCRWWVDKGDDADGRCFCHPPVMQIDEEGTLYSLHPRVNRNGYCSEFFDKTVPYGV